MFYRLFCESSVSIVCLCACACVCILGYNIKCVLLGMIHGNWVAQKVHSSTAYCSLGLTSHLRNRITASLWKRGLHVTTHTRACYVVSRSVVSDSLWPLDYSRPCSSVHGIFQARILEWVATWFWWKTLWSCQSNLTSLVPGKIPGVREGKWLSQVHDS